MYLISSYGRLFSTRYRGVKGRVCELKQKVRPNGYLEATLCIDNNSKHVSALIHRLVAIAWVPNPKNKPEVNHKFPNKSHNYYWNLEWVTPKENISHAEKHKLRSHRSGENVTTSKFSEKQIQKVCKMLEKNKGSYKYISEKTGVSTNVIRSVLSGRIWTGISSYYDFSNYNKGKSIKNINAKYKKIHNVCKMLESNKYTIKQISNKTGISYGMVIKILNKESYVYISDQYMISNYMSKSPKNKHKKI